MRRRDILKFSAAAGAAGIAAPAVAQTQPKVRWRLASSFPKSLDTVYGGAPHIAERVRLLTGGQFEIQPFAAGELVPALQVLDAVSNATVECGHTGGFYYIGKKPALAFDTGVPLGMTARQHLAWMRHGGGQALMNEAYRSFNVVAFPAGATGAQMGGWFRKEIKSVADLKGLKMRASGLQGNILAKLGVATQVLAAGDIYPALERGVIDAVEWVGPYDDEKLGFHKAATYYYAPGIMEMNASISLIINQDRYNELPELYRTALDMACTEAYVDMLAKYDALNIAALRRLLAANVKLSFWPDDVMKALSAAATEVYNEIAARNEEFAKVYRAWSKFREDMVLWSAINDGGAEHFINANRR